MIAYIIQPEKMALYRPVRRNSNGVQGGLIEHINARAIKSTKSSKYYSIQKNTFSDAS